MPEKAVELMVFVYDLVDEDRESEISQIFQIVTENGFHGTTYGDEPEGDALLFQPFEDTPQNEELLQECVREIEAEFPDFDVEYWMGRNRDSMRLPEKKCKITVNTS